MKIVFLDRDGVINQFPGVGNYVTRWEDFHFLPKAAEAVGLLTRAGFEVRIISNQGCIARGLLSKKELRDMTERMVEAIEIKGGKINGVHYCVHQTSDDCRCKKPKTGLLKQALKGRKLKSATAYFIGDSREDMEAGKAAGCQTVLALSGRTSKQDVKSFIVKPDFIKKDLWSAVKWILEVNPKSPL